jgi:hypothetical protein
VVLIAARNLPAWFAPTKIPTHRAAYLRALRRIGAPAELVATVERW